MRTSPAGELGRLAAVLDRLEPHSADVNAAGGTGAWEAGGGVYSAYLYLKVGAGLGVCWSSGWVARAAGSLGRHAWLVF